MSVYKRPGQEAYSFDFRLGGRRFSGGTGKATVREARKFEAEQRQLAKAELARDQAIDAPDTWHLAASRYWLEVGVHHKNAATTLWSLEWLTTAIGKARPLREIDDNLVAALVAKRRGETRRVGKRQERTDKVGPATVNRTMIEPLRKVLLRAARVWKVSVGEVRWRQHMLPESRERVREASPGEEAAIYGKLARGYDEAVAFAFRDGCRGMEICGLTWTRVDFFGRQFTVIGKGGKARTIPMSQATFDQLWRLRGQHPEFAFTYTADRTRRAPPRVRGQHYPLQRPTLSKVIKAAARSAGVENFHLHDTRHTAATRVLRKSNLRVVQTLLGHENIATTTKYAHALAEDVRAALDAASATYGATKSATEAGGHGVKSLPDRGKTA